MGRKQAKKKSLILIEDTIDNHGSEIHRCVEISHNGGTTTDPVCCVKSKIEYRFESGKGLSSMDWNYEIISSKSGTEYRIIYI